MRRNHGHGNRPPPRNPAPPAREVQRQNQQQIQRQAYQQWLTHVRNAYTGPLVKQSSIKYRYFRFIPMGLRGGGADWYVQLSLLEIKSKGQLSRAINATNPGGGNPRNEEPSKAIDGNVNTKWLDHNRRPLILDFGNPVEMDMYTWATANDCSYRDPISWRLEASNDRQSWFLLDSQDNYPVPMRRHQRLPDITPAGLAPLSIPTAEELVAIFNGLEISFNIPSQDLTLGNRLGSGGFGDVYEGKWLSEIPVAVKRLKSQTLTLECAEEFSREAKIMARLRSPNIVQLFGVCIDTYPYSIVMECAGNGSLHNVLSTRGRLDWETNRRIAIEIAQGIYFLHSHNMLHCDLKSQNVLLDEGMHAKLTDFGLVRVRNNIEISTGSTRIGGTIFWMAPEVLDFYLRLQGLFLKTLVDAYYPVIGNPPSLFGIRTDVYSYAMILWEIVNGNGEFPYTKAVIEIGRQLGTNNMSEIAEELFRQIINGKTREIIPDDCPPVLKNMIVRCWDGDAGNRPPVKTILTHLKENSVIPTLS